LIERLLAGDKRTVIAEVLGVSVRQINRHLANVRQRINVQTTLQLAVFFARRVSSFDR